jgi:4'-phosphopantetheinyl transferase
MILWLVQSTADDADLARGAASPGLLSPGEAARLAGLRTPKRQHDWLLGRWTAKHLVQRYVKQATGTDIALPAIEIVNDGDGVPMIVTPGTDAAFPSTTAPMQDLALSISHCEEYALCALLAPDSQPGNTAANESPSPGGIRTGMGADIERIRPRARRFVEDYFTAAEVALVDQAPAGMQDMLVTTIWSAKEAALKAVHLGLTVDTRRVACCLETALPYDTWQPLTVTYSPYSGATEPPASHILPGWWRTLGAYVLTIVVTEDGMARPELI